MPAPGQYMSFLIRLWQDPGMEARPATSEWYSQIEHIQSGKRWDFATLDDLLVFLRQQAGFCEWDQSSPAPE